MIISTRRCGSTYLSSRLNNCPGVFCDKEFVLRDEESLQANHIRIEYKNFSLADAIDNNSCNVSIRGSKLTVPEYQVEHLDTFFELLDGKSIHLVHIIRNLAQQFVSLMAVKQTSIWHVVNNDAKSASRWMQNANQYVEERNYSPLKPEMLIADRDEVERFCQMVTKIDTGFARLSNNNKYLRINYNEIDQKFAFVLRHLNISETPSNLSVKSLFKPMIKFQHNKLIKNWNQILDVFDEWEEIRERNISAP